MNEWVSRNAVTRMNPWRASLKKFHLSTRYYGKGHVCMHVSTHVFTSARACGKQRATSGVIPFLPSCYLRQRLSLAPELAGAWDWLAMKLQEFACLCLCLWSTGLYAHATMPSFYIWVLVIKAKSTCPHGKPSTRWAIFLVPDKVLLRYNTNSMPWLHLAHTTLSAFSV